MAERLIVPALATLMLGAAQAQPLSDPTRPAGEGSAQARQADAAPSRLQSVLISPSRSVAVIDGHAVSVGDRIGDARLVEISATEVVLQRGAERQTLRLHPGVDKRELQDLSQREVKP